MWGLAIIAPATFLFGGDPMPLAVLLQWDDALNLLFLGVVASAACFVTWSVSVEHLGPTISTTYIYLVPAITATASVLLLGEPLNLPIVAGVLMTVAGLLLSQKREPAPSP